MKTVVSRLSDPISLLSFLDTFRTFYDVSSIHEGTAIWLLPQFNQEPTNTVFSNRLTAEKTNSQPEGKLATYSQMLYNLLQTCVTYYLIAEVKANIKTFKQLSGMSIDFYAQALQRRILDIAWYTMSHGWDEYLLLTYFLLFDIHRAFTGAYKKELKYLVLLILRQNLVKLQEGSHSPALSIQEENGSQIKPVKVFSLFCRIHSGDGHKKRRLQDLIIIRTQGKEGASRIKRQNEGR